MAKSKITPIRPATDPGDALYNACAEFADARAALLIASEVLSDSAFSGSNAITEERDCCAVLVVGKAVEQLTALQVELDRISVALNQPKAIARLKADQKVVANG